MRPLRSRLSPSSRPFDHSAQVSSKPGEVHYDPANLFRLNQNIRPSTQPAAIPRARLGAPTASSRAEAPRGSPASLKRRA